ncbi:hypothetical protein QVD17_11554 [Tagetes erecta]|uniref:Uncharacterized protein n=1 Tax=Tagetes erecta TaxID=13708 RepID=A0AAD8P2A3_TARER|nr:hypothetical protein QVD17_11554 [Tagetes erecta]
MILSTVFVSGAKGTQQHTNSSLHPLHLISYISSSTPSQVEETHLFRCLIPATNRLQYCSLFFAICCNCESNQVTIVHVGC